MQERIWARAYHRELGGAFIIYAALLVPTLRYGHLAPEGLLRTALSMSPMLGIGLIIWAVVRQLGRVDEYIRSWTLENIAIAAAITTGLSITYGFMENLGYPRLSMFAVCMMMCFGWAVTCVARAVLKR